jgi:twinkle protein
LYDSFGNNEWEPLKEKIEYLHHAEGVTYFFIDHPTALAQWQDDERKTLDIITSEMGGMVQKMPITIFFVSHLTTPEGKPHEEGGRVMARHLRGSRSIIQWASFIIGLERDQQAEDMRIRTTTTVRCLKDRFAGRGTGQTFFLRYNFENGLLSEVDYEMESRGDDDPDHFPEGHGGDI